MSKYAWKVTSAVQTNTSRSPPRSASIAGPASRSLRSSTVENLQPPFHERATRLLLEGRIASYTAKDVRGCFRYFRPGGRCWIAAAGNSIPRRKNDVVTAEKSKEGVKTTGLAATCDKTPPKGALLSLLAACLERLEGEEAYYGTPEPCAPVALLAGRSLFLEFFGSQAYAADSIQATGRSLP